MSNDRDRTRTCNPQIRSLMPYPLGHTATSDIAMIKYVQETILMLYHAIERATLFLYSPQSA